MDKKTILHKKFSEAITPMLSEKGIADKEFHSVMGNVASTGLSRFDRTRLLYEFAVRTEQFIEPQREYYHEMFVKEKQSPDFYLNLLSILLEFPRPIDFSRPFKGGGRTRTQRRTGSMRRHTRKSKHYV